MGLQDIVVNNRYRLDQRRGRGLLTDDYDAHDTLLDRPVTVKALLPELTADKDFVDRFRQQAQVAANLTHPGLVGVLDWGREAEGIDGRPGPTYFLVTEHNTDRTLTDFVASNGPLPVERTLHVLIGLTSVVDYCHREGVLHGGITPDLITVSARGDVRVAEVALANSFPPEWSPPEIRWDQALWRAPETLRGEPGDARTDVYQIGALAYYLVTAMAPFPGETVSVVRQRALETIPPAPIKKNPKVPKSLQSIIGKSMAKLSNERYSSVADQRDALVRLREQRDAARTVASETPSTMTDDATAVLGNVGALRPTPDRREAALTAIGHEADDDATVVVPPLVSNGRKRTVTVPDDEGRVTSDIARLDGKRKRNGLYLAVLAILLAVLGGLVFLLARQLGVLKDSGATIVVPDVVGQESGEANRVVASAGLVVTAVMQPNDTFAANVVFATKPKAGAKVAKNSTVTVFVSTGVDKPVIPSVVGETVEVARSRLLAAGFAMVAADEPNDTAAPGTVIRQDPAADADAIPGQTVNVFVAKATLTVVVPDVAGKSPDDANIDLRKIGFRVAIQQEASPTVPKGTVTRTEPAAAAKVDRGAAVVIFVSAGKGLAVPSVIGSSQADATATLTASGFKVDATSRPVSDPADVQRVMSQTPSAGTEAEPGATVVIRIGVLSADTTTSRPRRTVPTENTAVVTVVTVAPEPTPPPTPAPTAAPTAPPETPAPTPVPVTAQAPTTAPA